MKIKDFASIKPDDRVEIRFKDGTGVIGFATDDIRLDEDDFYIQFDVNKYAHNMGSWFFESEDDLANVVSVTVLGPAEPLGKSVVIDKDGDAWQRYAGSWQCCVLHSDNRIYYWDDLVTEFGPVTVILKDQS